VPRFASPIHVLSLAASFDLENRKNSMSHLDSKAPPGQSGGKSFSKQQSMPSSSLRAVPSSGQGVSLRSQASAPNHGRHGSLDTLNVRVGSQKDSSLLDSDLLASFEEALEMLSADERHNVRASKAEDTKIFGQQKAGEAQQATQVRHGMIPTFSIFCFRPIVKLSVEDFLRWQSFNGSFCWKDKSCFARILDSGSLDLCHVFGKLMLSFVHCLPACSGCRWSRNYR
jgi:hypothetical protein